MPFVSRDQDGAISGRFENKQPFAEEYLEPDDPELSVSVITRDEVEQKRLRAYADPVLGSDRYFAEAKRLSAMGSPESEVIKVTNEGVSAYKRIQEQFPWPK